MAPHLASAHEDLLLVPERINDLSGEINARPARDGHMCGIRLRTCCRREWIKQSDRAQEGRAMQQRNQDQRISELSRQVTELQFPLNLALLKLQQRFLPQAQPANDNNECAA